MNIKSATKIYEVIFHNDFKFLHELYSEDNAFFILDRKVFELYNNHFSYLDKDSFILLDALEENKTIDTALQICEQLTLLPAKRNIHLVSVGGGIIQDVTGFIANILYRGIHWSFVPTTLLASTDSCIGGKTSLNYKHYKNLLGTFYPPDSIHICPLFFETLSKKDYYSGLGEVVKFNIIAGENSLSQLKSDLPFLLDRDSNTLLKYVKNSLSFKKTFIEKDEFDCGERVLLNYAHTFGHAYETVTGYHIPHGTAVAIGAITANRISALRNILSKKSASEIENILLQIISIDSDCDDSFDSDNIISAIRKDKKQISEDLTAVLLYEGMDMHVVHDITPDEINAAVDYTIALINNHRGSSK